jgi:Flp pilus assembly protein TadG
MRKFAFLAVLSRRVAKLRRDQRGVSAVEFAMILPMMCVLYLGAEEVTKAVSIYRKLTMAAYTVSDLASQVPSISNADIPNLLKSAEAVLDPYEPAPLKVTLSAVNIDATGNATVAWSDTLRGEARGVNQPVPVPDALRIPNSQLIWAEVGYKYTPLVGYVLKGPFEYSEQIWMRPRVSDKVQRPTS